jgi:hypothetical protein
MACKSPGRSRCGRYPREYDPERRHHDTNADVLVGTVRRAHPRAAASGERGSWKRLSSTNITFHCVRPNVYTADGLQSM